MKVRGFIEPIALCSIALACTSGAADVGSAGGPASATIVTPTIAEPDVTATVTTINNVPPSLGTSEPPPTTRPTSSTSAHTTTAPPSVGEPRVASEAIGEFEQPVDLAVRPGDDALWIVEQSGRLVRVDGDNSSVVLDISGRINSGGERGLLGLAFDAEGTRAYANFTDRGDDTVIAAYEVGDDGSIEAATERIVLRVEQPFRNHNAGDLAFGPDGMLYVPLGDGGSGGDPQRNGSEPLTLLGSILRIDPSPNGGEPYTVPDDNPFASGAEFDGRTGAPEVWAWGLRNPWKIAFDPVTNELWIPDVGQNEFEEINVASPADGQPVGRGLDFGWSAFEGTERFNPDVADTGRTVAPVLTYNHDDGCSISGGVPYRGTVIADLEPAFVYSDFCTGTIWALDLAASRSLTLLEGFEEVTAIRAGPDGELYVLERSGTVHRLTQG